MFTKKKLGAAAALAVLELAGTWAAAPVAIDNYKDFVEFVGLGEDYGTGARFGRESIVLFHAEGVCEPDFAGHGMLFYAEEGDDLFALVSVDLDHADQDLLDRLLREAASSARDTCPGMVVRARSLVEKPDVKKLKKDARGSFQKSLTLSQAASIGITNEMPYPVDILYSYRGSQEMPTHIKSLKPGRESYTYSYKLTNMVAVNTQTRERVASHWVRGHGIFTVADRECTAENCGASEAATLQMDEASMQARLEAHKRLQNLNSNQPRGLPVFTEVGFAKQRVPDEAWDRIKTFYEENKHAPKKEAWGNHNVFTNNVESPTYMVTLPEGAAVKPGIYNIIKPVLEEWSGVDLTFTSMYGIRAYQNTSWLNNHVDTRSTHAVSVIINVDQRVEEDWALMIYDHVGNDYNITMKPRDMVLYESATCVHGRPKPLNGTFYANTFIHFKPTDPAAWEVYAGH